ncbi:MAG: inorganic diphosphatase [Chloroflexi bacterium]|nr:inorganic diphosphatase [Chloroflexota bacterium]
MAPKSKKATPVLQLETYDEASGDLNVVIETPKHSRIKFKYDEETGIFKASGFMPEGMSFPYDFGFVPSTRGEDGDPLDVLLLMDAPAFAGCLVTTRLIGVIEAEQREESGETVRNDRLIGIAAESRVHADVKSIDQLSSNMLDEIEHFFKSYTEVHGKQFIPRARASTERAQQIVNEGMRGEKDENKSKRKSK